MDRFFVFWEAEALGVWEKTARPRGNDTFMVLGIPFLVRENQRASRRAPVPLRALLDTPPGDEIRLVRLPRLIGSCGVTGGYFCRRFAPYRFGSFCFPGVENYSTGWIVEGSSFLISLQMKSSISMSER